jgi:hypothetical protein
MGDVWRLGTTLHAARNGTVTCEADLVVFAEWWARTNGFEGRPVAQWHTPPTRSTVPLYAEVNDGRWIAQCPCHDGIACDPDIPVGVCLGCGTIHPVLFPAKREQDKIEAALKSRPRGNTNWRPGETVEWLQKENLLHTDPLELAAQIREEVR